MTFWFNSFLCVFDSDAEVKYNMSNDALTRLSNLKRWNFFIAELRAYIEEHHHCPGKHCTLYNAQKYYRRKMKEGSLAPDKAQVLEEILNMRDFQEHTGGRRKKE